MRNIEQTEWLSVSGGDGEVEGNLGAGFGYLIHGMVSNEAKICGMLSPWGLFIGAAIHYANNH